MNRIAKTITDVLAPWVLIIVVCLVTAWHATGTWTGTLVWGPTVALFTSVIPMGVILWRMRRKQATDIHVRNRADRIVPILAIVVSSTIALVIVYVADAPGAVQTLALAMVVGIVGTGGITAAWKISFHTAVAAASVIIYADMFGPWWYTTALVVAVIGWSRVVIQDHTIAQVTVGAAWGAATTWLVYALAAA